MNTWYEISIQKGDVKALIKSTESLEEVESLTADFKKAGINVVREEYKLENERVELVGKF
jgi:hypothetical protein